MNYKSTNINLISVRSSFPVVIIDWASSTFDCFLLIGNESITRGCCNNNKANLRYFVFQLNYRITEKHDTSFHCFETLIVFWSSEFLIKFHRDRFHENVFVSHTLFSFFQFYFRFRCNKLDKQHSGVFALCIVQNEQDSTKLVRILLTYQKKFDFVLLVFVNKWGKCILFSRVEINSTINNIFHIFYVKLENQGSW